MMWAKEISEGPHVGTTTPQGALGGAGMPRCYAHMVHPSLVIFAPKILKY